MNCKYCGKELKVTTKYIGYDENDNPITYSFAYCGKCQQRFDLDSNKNKKPKRKIGLFVFILSSFFILLLLFLLNYTKESPQTPKITNEKNPISEKLNKYYFVGDCIKTDNFNIYINSANIDFNDYQNDYGFFDLENDMKYICVNFTFENSCGHDSYVSIYDFDCYADNSLCEQTYIFPEDFINTNLSSGRNVSFSTYYIVPKDSESIELEYKEIISFSEEKIIIKLK